MIKKHPAKMVGQRSERLLLLLNRQRMEWAGYWKSQGRECRYLQSKMGKTKPTSSPLTNHVTKMKCCSETFLKVMWTKIPNSYNVFKGRVRTMSSKSLSYYRTIITQLSLNHLWVTVEFSSILSLFTICNEKSHIMFRRFRIKLIDDSIEVIACSYTIYSFVERLILEECQAE